MKTIATSFAIAALALLGAAPQAEARSHRSNHSSRVYISGYRSCGTPVYTETYFIGYDRCGNPVRGERRVREEYRPVVRERYVEPCPQPYYGRERYTRYEDPCDDGRMVIQACFGR